MRIKPTHLRACAEVLDEDHPDASTATKAVLEKFIELTNEDITYAAVRQYVSQVDGTAMYMGYGGFPTKAAAVKAAEKGTVGIPGYGALAVVPVRSHASQLAKLKSLDDLPEHLGPSHWSRIKESIA